MIEKLRSIIQSSNLPKEKKAVWEKSFEFFQEKPEVFDALYEFLSEHPDRLEQLTDNIIQKSNAMTSDNQEEFIKIVESQSALFS